MLRPKATARKTPTWPTPTPEQVSVILLGTYHMDNPGLDDVNVTADDVLSENRQEEIETLVGHLEATAPDRIAVERPAARAATIDHLYTQYREGKYEYAEEHEFDPPHSEPEGETMECRSEVIQVGFRLADRLGHDSVLPVDVPEVLGQSEAFEALNEQGADTSPKIEVPRIDNEELEETMSERLTSSTVTEYHRFINEEAALHANDGMFDEFLRHGNGDNYAGPDALAKWYRRNLRIVHNVWQGVDDDTDRVLVLVGTGHVHILRHLLMEFPQFCPVTPLRYLPRGNR
jgi:hypothetical protein